MASLFELSLSDSCRGAPPLCIRASRRIQLSQKIGEGTGPSFPDQLGPDHEFQAMLFRVKPALWDELCCRLIYTPHILLNAGSHLDLEYLGG